MSISFYFKDDEDGNLDSLNSCRYDRKETADGYVVEISAQGLKKEKMKVTVVHKESSSRRGPTLDIVQLHESGEDEFVGQMSFAENANLGQAAATMKDGVLTITVPKTEGNASSSPETREIEIS
ncbi:hypothetical protein M569_06835 [Genlisea aurea]|uniref:SHSP domain-containing protein n=1 Tax=Genlisea aurea TaxID=192259 RepID=S8E6D3_9LAMI|nr:hypothetical protein M569_06835 [Genlisea aurea]